MTARTSTLHVRVDDQLMTDAAQTLARFGLSVSDAVRILLTRIVEEEGLTTEVLAHDAWFRGRVQQALAEPGTPVSHRQVMDDVQTVIDKRRHARD